MLCYLLSHTCFTGGSCATPGPPRKDQRPKNLWLVARGGCLRLFIFGKCVLCSVLMCTVSSILASHGPYWTKHVVDGRCEVRRALFYPIWPRKFLVACVAYSRRTRSSEQGESHRSIHDSLWWPRLLRCVVTDPTNGSTCRSRKKKSRYGTCATLAR